MSKPVRQLFGTDGIRGVAGNAPLDTETLSRIGIALAEMWSRAGSKPRVVLGRDTRVSGEWITRVLAASLADAGIDSAHDVGIISTPGLACLTKSHRFDLGIMISASHNPYQDNGIKIFGPDGFKLSDDEEMELEKLIVRAQIRVPHGSTGQGLNRAELVEDYERFLKGQIGTELSSLRLGLDVCNGSAYQIAPRVFRDLGAHVEVINVVPDGRNINRDCGSLHLSGLISLVNARALDLGVAFDGDADRSLFITSSGRVFDGDFVLYALALHFQKSGALRGNKVVGTVMSNYALERVLQNRGVEFIRASVGDRYVLEMMMKTGANLGGEPSGHVILSDCHTAGDGILTALKLAEMLVAGKVSLDDLAEGLLPYPQVLEELRVQERLPLSTPAIAALIHRAEGRLKNSGRLVIRYSGTEPLLRIMAEGENGEHVKGLVSELKRDIQEVFVSISKET